MKPQIETYLNSINQLLIQYKSGQIETKKFLNDSRTFIDLLEIDLGEKIEDLHSAWFDIEQAYAVALDRNDSINNYKNFVDSGINNMDFQIKFLLKE